MTCDTRYTTGVSHEFRISCKAVYCLSNEREVERCKLVNHLIQRETNSGFVNMEILTRGMMKRSIQT